MKLLQGDCLELMKSIPDKSVDMVLCDLPYGTTQNKWDTVIPFEPLWEQYKRICKENASVLLFSQMPFSAFLILSNTKMFKYEWIWQKTQGTGFLNSKKMPLKAHENILCFYQKPPTYNPQMQNGFKPYKCKSGKGSSNYGYQTQVTTISNGERFPKDIVCFDYDRGKKIHPTQKPVPLLEYLIKTYTNEGETVLDNCMGSGSTGVACVHTGRDFIGMELDEHYFSIAKERIEKETETWTLELQE